MAIRSGLAAQLGLGVESTVGTAVTPNRWYEFTSESLALTIERIESEGLRAGNRVMRSDRWTAGQRAVEGSFSLDMTAENSGILFKHLLGAVSTTGAGPYTHECTLGDPHGLGFTLEVGRPDNSGTVRAFTYNGVKLSEATFSNEVNGLLTGEFSVIGQDETTGSITSASYPASQELLSFTGASITVGGSSYNCTDISISVNTGLDAERYSLGSATIREPIAANMVEITAEVNAEFASLTEYNRVVNGTTAALVAKWEGSVISGGTKRSIEFNMPVVRFDGSTPNVDGPGIVQQPLTGKALFNGTDSALKVTVVNSDSAA